MTTTQATESRTHRTESAAEVVGRLRATFNTGVTRPLDWRIDQLQRLRALLVENEQELIEAAINGMLTSLDPHSSYLSAEDAADRVVAATVHRRATAAGRPFLRALGWRAARSPAGSRAE